MIKAFVFGKFLPFHKGHEAMINFALTKCDRLTVLICCSDKEKIPGAVRRNWIEKTFEQEARLQINIYEYSENELPNTSVSSVQVSAIWAGIFKKELVGHSLLITSEPYGEYVASFMNIRHIAFDVDRIQIPVSASAINDDLFQNWKYLPAAVKPYYAKKVVILGTESTGKTTLTEDLTKHFNCTAVMEAARDIIANSNSFCFDDLHLVAKEHAKRIEQAMTGESPLVIIDTDIHITKSYARFVFDRELIVSNEIYESNLASLYLYLDKDVAYFQDGTRLNEMERNQIDASHRRVLKDDEINIVEINGSWEDRFKKAVKQINQVILKKASLHKIQS